MSKIVPFRKSAMKALDKANAQVETAFRIIALLRRRTLHPVDGKTVMIEFETTMEATELQRLIHALPKRRQKKSG